MVQRSSSRFARTCSALALLAAGGWVLYTFPPAATRWYPKCAFFVVTGLQCPGCGTTRALHELLHGHVAAAFALNPMLFAFLAFGLFAAPSILRGEVPRFTTKPWFGWGSFVVLTGWWIGRNLL